MTNTRGKRKTGRWRKFSQIVVGFLLIVPLLICATGSAWLALVPNQGIYIGARFFTVFVDRRQQPGMPPYPPRASIILLPTPGCNPGSLFRIPLGSDTSIRVHRCQSRVW